MKQIVFFVESKLINVQKNRLGLSYYLKKKLKIKIFNIGPIIRPEYFKKYFPSNIIKFSEEKILANEKQILDAIKNLGSKTFVFFNISKNIKTKFIFDEIEKKILIMHMLKLGICHL